MTRLRADFLLLTAAFIWGTAFIAQKTAIATMGPLQFVGARFLLSAVLLAPLAYLEARRPGAPLTKRQWAMAGLIGLCLFLGSAVQQVGLTTTTVTNAGFITSLYIALVPFVGWAVARTRLRPTILAAVAVSLLGAWLLANHGQAEHLTSGDFLVLAAALLYAVHIVLVSMFLAERHRPFLLCIIQYGVTAFCGVAAGGVFEPFDWVAIAPALPAILYAGLLSGGVGYTLQIVAQRYTPAAEAALIMSLESVFAALGAAFLLGERLPLLGIVGCGLILFGALMAEIAPALPRRRSAVPAP